MVSNLVFIDEFKVSMHKGKLYMWSKKRSRGYIRKHVKDREYSSITAFSQTHLYGVMPNDQTNTSKKSLLFIEDVYRI